MNVRDIVVDLVAATPNKLGVRGKFFGIIDAVGGIEVSVDESATVLRGAGGSIDLQQFFDYVTLTSSTTQQVRVLVADAPQVISNIVTAAPGASVTTVQDEPSDTVATPDDNAIGAATTENIAANPARRRITIGVLSTADDPIRVQAVGANDASGAEIVPGMSHRFDTTVSLDVRCNGAVGSVYWIFEESGP